MRLLDFTWNWVPPSESRAHLWDNPLPDALRILCAVLGVVLALLIGRILIEDTRRVERLPRTQRVRFWSLILADLSITATELSVVGTVMTPRLLVNIACLVLAGWGVRGARVRQRRTPVAPRDATPTSEDR